MDIVAGTVVAKTTSKSSELLYRDRIIEDFEVKYQLQVKEGKGKAGLVLRCNLNTTQAEFLSGLYVEFASGTWGSLYDFTKQRVSDSSNAKFLKVADFQQVQKVVKLTDFNDFHVRCVGKRCTVTLNGLVAVDGEFPEAPNKGKLGFFVYRRSEATFREVYIRELNTAAK